MELIMFSVFDSKAEAYIQPFFSPNHAVGIRDFTTAANDPNTQFHINAGDYTLFELGKFDQATGKITKLNAPKNLGTAISFKRGLHSV